MSFNGILLKVGDYTITGDKYIKYESYSVTKNSQDLDSYRDSNGVLHRNALDCMPLKVELETRDGLTNVDMENFFGNIRRNFTVAKERKCSVYLYVPETDSYITQNMYMPDPKMDIKRVEGDPSKGIPYRVIYKSIRFAFIGYGDESLQ